MSTPETNATLSPTEAIADSVRVMAGVNGTIRTARDVMVSFGTVNDPRAPAGIQFYDMFLTWEQAENLHKELTEALTRKP